MRTLCLCADDFGLSDGVCRGILSLVRQGRLQAVSVLTGGVAWSRWAPALFAEPAVREGRVAVGLHFNLTDGQPLADELRTVWPRFPGLLALLVRSHLRWLPVPGVRAEWQAQWEAFAAAAGRPPDYVDGHQHVHHLPLVRDVVLQSLRNGRQASPACGSVAVRSTACMLGPGHGFKRWVIAHSGGLSLARRLDAQGVRHNASLSGAYDFAATDYRALVQAWLAHLPQRGAMLFCHPGEADASVPDAIADARVRELAYLGSASFADDLNAAGVQLGPAW